MIVRRMMPPCNTSTVIDSPKKPVIVSWMMQYLRKLPTKGLPYHGTIGVQVAFLTCCRLPKKTSYMGGDQSSLVDQG